MSGLSKYFDEPNTPESEPYFLAKLFRYPDGWRNRSSICSFHLDSLFLEASSCAISSQKSSLSQESQGTTSTVDEIESSCFDEEDVDDVVTSGSDDEDDFCEITSTDSSYSTIDRASHSLTEVDPCK